MKKFHLVLTVFVILFTNRLSAQPGILDCDFDADGKLTTAIGAGDDRIQSVAIQPDGKIVVAGYSKNGANKNFALARYNIDGTLDNSFSVDGKVTTAIGSGNNEAASVAIQTDGKIIATGSSYNGSNYDFALARYNTDGTLDGSFSIDGMVTTAIGTGDDQVLSAALQPDGKIVVAGISNNGTNWDFALARYNTDGTLDNSFSTDGKLITAFGIGNDMATSVGIQTDGKIVVAGITGLGTNADFALARYNTDGTLDVGFGTNGKVTTAIGTTDEGAFSLAIQTDGKIVAAGASENGTNNDFALVRYHTNGLLDNTFGTNGKLTTDIASTDEVAQSVVIQPDGKIVAAGYSDNGTNADFNLVRYNTNGTLDNIFGNNGIVITAFGVKDDLAHSAAIQPNGRIVVAGYSNNGTNDDFALARYISGLNIGIIDFSVSDNSSVMIYPNPIRQDATLEYTLKNPEEISIHLLDMQGKIVKTFLDCEKQQAGEHRQMLDLPEGLVSGSYIVVISSPGGRASIKIIK